MVLSLVLWTTFSERNSEREKELYDEAKAGVLAEVLYEFEIL